MRIPSYKRCIAWLGSSTAFRVIIGLLVLQAVWIALSGRYPMAFDEDFHLGIIKLYAHHISPFWSAQPHGADKFGPVVRDPSYLYQYLMSYPYRLISLFTHDQTIQVIILRFINIGIFAWGLTLYHQLLRKARASTTMANACLLVLVLIPVVPLLAAQINYDNLLLPLTALSLLWTLEFNQVLTVKRRLDLFKAGEIVILGLLTSLVKYAYLPIFIAIIIFCVARVWQKRQGLKKQPLSRRAKYLLAAGLIIATGLFSQRYVANLVRYHEPAPNCADVLSVKQCSQYGPWIRDYNFALANVQPTPAHARLTFLHAWLYGLWLRSFFAVDGPGTQNETRGPLLVPGMAAIIFSVVGGLALLSQLPAVFRVRHRPEFWLFGLVSILYLGALWEDEYKAFIHTGQPVAINGRYLLPVLPLIMIMVAVALSRLLKHWQPVKLALLSFLLICLVWGGGALTYILRSNDAWYWPNPLVRRANYDVRQAIAPITPGSRHVQFLH